MAQAKKIEIIYDIDGKAVDVAINKTLNLQQQARALTAELRRTKEGTAEFQLLSKRLGDVQDGLRATTAKSRDLFGSLSLLPGPVGAFFNQLSGAVDMLKLFSSFSLSDLKFQFGEIVDDIKQIGTNLSSTSVETKNLDASTTNLNNTLSNTAGVSAAASNALKENASNAEKLVITNGKLVTKEEAMKAAMDARNQAVANGNAATLTAIERNELLASSTNTATAATGGLTTALNVLKATLIGLGIGVLIILITTLVSAIYDWVSGTEEADAANQKLNDTLKEQQRILANDTAVLDAATKAAITRAKIAGKSEKEIYEITRKGGEERLELLREYDKQLYDDQKKATNDRNLTDEQRTELLKKLNEEILKSGQAINAQIMANEQARLDFQLSLIDKNKTAKKQEYDEIIEREKQYRATLQALRIEEGREREVFEANANSEKERREVEKLNIEKKNEGIRTKLLQEIEEKRKLTIAGIDKKYDEEELKARNEFNKKLADINIAAIDDQVKRDISTREEKLRRDLYDLEQDKLFIKKADYEKKEIRKAMEVAAQNDIDQIILDAEIKRRTSILGIAEARQKVLLEGTRAYTENALQIEDEAYEIRKLQAKNNAEELERIEKEHEANVYSIKLRGVIAEKQLAIERMDTIKSIGQSLQILAGENKALAISGIVVEKSAAIGQIIANTGIANAKAVAASPLTFGQPWVTINTIAAGLSIAATIKGAVDAISQINNAGNQATAEASGTRYADASYRGYEDGGLIGGKRHAQGGTMIEAEAGEAIMTRGAVTMFAPLLSMINQAGGGTAFSPNAMVSSYDKPVDNNNSIDQMIIKTYVVESDLTSLQHKQARLKDLSTL